jgi:hypothetical protein
MKPIAEIADVVELKTWAAGASTTIGSLKEDLEAALSGEDMSDAERMAQEVTEEFQRRQILLLDAYPFSFDGYRLHVNHAEPARTTYLFCLALSLLPAFAIENDQRSVQFETIVMDAAMRFFGGSALRIGAPWRSAEIPDYGTLLDKVIELIPNLGPKLKVTAPGGGDAGWDVLVVKNFRDDLYPRLVALGNCATGRNDWKRKGVEVQPTLFWSYFSHDHRSVLLTFFAVPFAMDEDARLRKLSSTNLTLDRFRICEHAPAATDDVAEWLQAKRDAALEVTLV